METCFVLLISLVLVILRFVVLFAPCLRAAKSPTSRKAPGIDMESVKESSVGSCVEKLMNGHRDLHGVGMVRLRVVRGESTARDRQPTSGSQVCVLQVSKVVNSFTGERGAMRGTIFGKGPQCTSGRSGFQKLRWEKELTSNLVDFRGCPICIASRCQHLTVKRIW